MATSDLAGSSLLGIFLIWKPWPHCLLIALQSSSFCFSWDHSWFSDFPGSSANKKKKNPPAMQETWIRSLNKASVTRVCCYFFSNRILLINFNYDVLYFPTPFTFIILCFFFCNPQTSSFHEVFFALWLQLTYNV